MRTPSLRNCCTRRHTSERLAPISCASLVPLTTIMALSASRRTMRPRRASVSPPSCERNRAEARSDRGVRDLLFRGMARLCPAPAETETETENGVKVFPRYNSRERPSATARPSALYSWLPTNLEEEWDREGDGW